jgi:hypothetical protein
MAAPTIKQPNKHFTPTLYEGNGTAIGSGGKTITGLEFKPDLVWIKNRDATDSHSLYDSSRGATKQLESDTTTAETTESEGLTSFTSNGFTLGSLDQVNTNNESFVGWSWKASGGSAPSITYTVKVVSDSGNKYRFDDFGTSAVTLDLQEGGTYTFDQSDSSNATHPLRFYTAADKSGGEYTTGVTTNGTPGSSGAYTRITVAASAPTLYYQCSSHAAMGGAVNTNSTFGSSNFAGSIQSTVQTNSDAGFSIVKYTGTGSAGTVGHGLSSAPEWVMTKSISNDTSDGFTTYHTGLTSASYYIDLSKTNAQNSASVVWNGTAPTSSVFSIGSATGTNTSSATYVAYCWHGVDGFSKFGKYTGTGSNPGPFIYTGFKVSWLLVKANNAANWYLCDDARSPINPLTTFLHPDRSDADYSNFGRGFDFLSNGFKVRQESGYGNNYSGVDTFYMAFAELPFFDDQSPVTAR